MNLINQLDLNIILKSEVYDEQLRAAHLTLGYTPISSSFQAHKCVIKARDPHLYQINVVVPGVLGFLVTNPISEGMQQVELPLLRTAEEVTTPSQPTIKEE